MFLCFLKKGALVQKKKKTMIIKAKKNVVSFTFENIQIFYNYLVKFADVYLFYALTKKYGMI